MKKLLAILLALAMVAAFAACGEKKAEPEAAPEAEVIEEVEEVEEVVEEEPVEEPEEIVEEEPVEEEEAPVEEEEIPIIGGIAEEAGWWYEVIADSGEYTDLAGNLVEYVYAIPAFNIDTEDASRINDEIMSLCQPYVDEIKDGVENGYSAMTLSVVYEANRCGDIGSIFITIESDFGYSAYYAFNMNLATGAEATGADIIAQVNLSEDAFVEAAQNVTAECFKDKYGSIEGDPMYQELYDKTMSADMFSLYMPMFFDNMGQLKIVVPIYSMAGAEYYYEVLSVQ